MPVAIAKMVQAGSARLLVMSGDQLLGLLTMGGVIRRLKVGQTVGASIVVTDGLSGGELVVTSGMQGLRQGLPVMAVPAEKPVGG